MATNGTYRFRLRPGDYVLEADQFGSWVAVTVRAEKTQHVDIPSLCF
jgi:hypothetical protein